MNTGHPSINALWADLIVEELTRLEIDTICLSPGSRSTPLIAAVATHPGTKTIMHFDERGAAFYALGYARATGKPAVLICTSGTAAANYHPAVVEASMDRVPMLVLTADRPPELRDTGANQTIDQVRLYGGSVRWFCDLPCPDPGVPPEFVLTTIDQAAYRALRAPAGPVHINCMFREPLAPLGPDQDFAGYMNNLERWRQSGGPYTRNHVSTMVCEPARLEDAAGLLSRTKKGLVVVGRLKTERERRAVKKLSAALGWPVLADIGSGLRTGGESSALVSCYDHLLASDSFASQNRPDTVLHFGSIMTSKRLNGWLSDSRPPAYIHVANHPARIDPDHLVTHRYDSDIALFCDFLLPFVNTFPPAEWTAGWRAADETAGAAIDRALAGRNEISEPQVARFVTGAIGEHACLYAASSMPVRDLDMYADPTGPAAPIGCNRGASGIDGTIASAIGFAAGYNRRVTVLIGDLALLHDLNSLALIKYAREPVTILVLNNNGGGIFSFLPVAARTDLFEDFWGTPHDLSFEKAAAQFGLHYEAPVSPDELERTYRLSQTEGRSTLIEIRTDRKHNHALHRQLLNEVSTALNK